MIVDDDFEGGSIVVLGRARRGEIELALRPDTAAPFLQWFHFRVRGAPRSGCSLRVVNAGEATFAEGFRDYRAFASYDLARWFRVPTRFDGETLAIRHAPARPDVYYAYFAPYPAARRERLLRAARRSPRARVGPVAAGLQGREVNLVVVGDDDAELKIWVVARQHSGEAMAEWLAEGLLGRLLDPGDALVAALLERAAFYVVPNLNPDGAALGNQRANAAGTDLNRAWADPSEGESPEVLGVRGAMLATGVDLFLDVHGDERIPYVFVAGCEGNPGYTDRLAALEDRFSESLLQRSPDFQREHGYAPDPPGEGDRRTAANFVGEAFDCLSFTLEMPFKDNADRPSRAGWSPQRSMDLGRALIESAYDVADALR
ncbi:MAG TPA: M14-type cytosolic carboxypeptidase [Polyangiaceae bacterium]|nr:M14-type cytosolic carboxypeptidase [Polyangiaceae bacterium]